MLTAIIIVTFVLFLVLGLPIAFVLTISSIAAALYLGYPFDIICQRFFTAIDSFPLMAIPLFMLAGSFMSKGGITEAIIAFALSIVGGIRGSLAHVVAISGIIMGGISGSGVADTAALGTVMVPEMKKRGYNVEFSAALVAASGAIGLIIPPSIAIIIYGVTTQSSIGDLFLAAILPGVAIGLGFLIYSWWYTRKHDYPAEGAVPFKEMVHRFRVAFWALLMPVMIIWGIRGGVFTPTEGGAVVAVYALILSLGVYRKLTLKDILPVCMDAAINTAAIAIIIAATSLFGWILAAERIPQMLSAALVSISDNRMVLLLIVIGLLLICGMFLDSSPAILLLCPILAPALQQVGVNLVQFGIIMVITLTVGLLTPPVGTALFVASNVTKVPLTRLSIRVLPFIGVMMLVTLVIAFIPETVTWVIR
ncbi:MAG TPA: TRAP transporter large permease [Candidatus Avisuccinivibrio pullicola]|nr:TRAP transporter large permease [Candidatus Avisuccinivibrio pullicola]